MDMLAFENKQHTDGKRKYVYIICNKFFIVLGSKSPCIQIQSSSCSISLQSTLQNPVAA